jgi:putative Ca2+/H+ antiporter (TMEM165/GDT1 family)
MVIGRTTVGQPAWGVDVGIALAVFPVIFLGELPDKTMLASLVMATRGHPWSVWLGAAGGFLVHVVIATTIGVGLFKILPTRALDALVSVMFAVGAAFALREAGKADDQLVAHEVESHQRVVTTAFLVIFIAEWGDLTQILTANLAAHYHDPLSVGVGAVLALWSVAAIAVVGGQGLLRYVNVGTVRKITAGVLALLSLVTAIGAIRG